MQELFVVFFFLALSVAETVVIIIHCNSKYIKMSFGEYMKKIQNLNEQV